MDAVPAILAAECSMANEIENPSYRCSAKSTIFSGQNDRKFYFFSKNKGEGKVIFVVMGDFSHQCGIVIFV